MKYSQMVNGLIRCLREHDSGFFPTPAEFRKFCFNAPSHRSWTNKDEDMIGHDEVSEYTGKKRVRVPMPEEFKQLFKKYINKTSVNT